MIYWTRAIYNTLCVHDRNENNNRETYTNKKHTKYTRIRQDESGAVVIQTENETATLISSYSSVTTR